MKKNIKHIRLPTLLPHKKFKDVNKKFQDINRDDSYLTGKDSVQESKLKIKYYN